MNRRHFITSLATGAAVGATARLAASDDLTVKLPYSPTPKRQEVDFNVLLWAIAERETGFHGLDDRHLVGKKCGSRSRYQISEAVWKQHNTAVHGRFDRDCHGNAANWLAFRHLRWLDANIPPVYGRTAYLFAFAWHVGLEGFLRAHSNRMSMSTLANRDFARGYDYGKAVGALYCDRLRELAT